MATLSSMLGGSSGGVKSVQRGIASLSNGTTNVTISAVVLAKSILIVHGSQFNYSGYYYNIAAHLTSTTNINFPEINYWGGTNYVYSTAYWQVIEYN